MIFQSFGKLLQNNPSQHYSYESQTSHKTPWNYFYCCLGSLVAKTGEGERGTAIPVMGGLAGGEGGVREHEEHESYL